MKKALIIGSQGQDGSLLFELLQRENYRVIGIGRDLARSSDGAVINKVNILDQAQVFGLVAQVQPDEIYYLAAFHHSAEEVRAQEPSTLWKKSFDVHVTGLIHCLEAMKQHAPACRLFYAASSHVFGQTPAEPQNENTPLAPACVYGITKTAGVHCCRFYRQQHSLFASVGILYNHESHLRAEKFVSQKIIRTARAIRKGRESKLVLGDLSARIDWGYAPDYVKAMRHILQLDAADDFIIATGETHSVQEFVEIVFAALGLDWHQHVEERAGMVARRKTLLRGDATKLLNTGWKPSVNFQQMIHRLLEHHTHA